MSSSSPGAREATLSTWGPLGNDRGAHSPILLPVSSFGLVFHQKVLDGGLRATFFILKGPCDVKLGTHPKAPHSSVLHVSPSLGMTDLRKEIDKAVPDPMSPGRAMCLMSRGCREGICGLSYTTGDCPLQK